MGRASKTCRSLGVGDFEMKLRNLLLSALVALLLILTTGAIATLYGQGAFETWKPLGAPPYTPGTIMRVNFDDESMASIYVSSGTDSRVYRGSRVLCADRKCWEQASSIPEEVVLSSLHIDKQCQLSSERMRFRSASIKLCASYFDETAGSHLAREAHFVLLEDGRFFVRQFIPGSGVLLIVLAGSSVALLTALTLFVALSRSTRRTKGMVSRNEQVL